jgi:hypothetical protein
LGWNDEFFLKKLLYEGQGVEISSIKRDLQYISRDEREKKKKKCQLEIKLDYHHKHMPLH